MNQTIKDGNAQGNPLGKMIEQQEKQMAGK